MSIKKAVGEYGGKCEDGNSKNLTFCVGRRHESTAIVEKRVAHSNKGNVKTGEKLHFH